MIRRITDPGKVESVGKVYNRPIPTIADRLTRARDNLARVVAAMSDPAFELDANEGAAVVAAFNLAKGAGYPFDPFTRALVGVLRRQIGETVEGVEDFDDEREAEESGVAA